MRKHVFLATLLTLGVLMIPVYAQEGSETAKEKSAVELQDEADRISYSIGVQVGLSMRGLAADLKMEVFVAAIQDVMDGKELAMEQAQIRETMMALQTKMKQEQQEKRQRDGEENLVKGKAYLEENAKKEGVKITESGLQYKVIEEGSGDNPGADDRVKVHYRGTLIDGTQFDSSYDRGEPAVFGVTQVIPGWTEALQLMKPGAKWELCIPSDLAYGPNGQRTIPPNAVLLFEVELIEVVSTGEVTIPK